MDSSHWIKLFEHYSDPGDQWVGKITLAADKSAYWKFELVSSVSSALTSTGLKAFDDRKTATGLIDLQRECTLIFPIATSADPGSFGVNYVAMREVIEGQFTALLENAAIENLEEPYFDTLTVASDSFVAWFGAPSPHTADSGQSLVSNVQDLSFVVQDLGSIEIRSAVYTSLKTWSANRQAVSTLKITFTERQSLKQLMSWASELELLFQFLTGKSTRWSSFSASGEKSYEVSDNYILTFGKTPHKTDGRPHPAECRHVHQLGGGFINTVLENYARNRARLAPIIASLSYARHQTTILQDKFALIMPLLEQYLKEQFFWDDEISYASSKNDFFAWIESSHNPEIIEFSKKHMKEVSKKSPSLKTLLKRSAATMAENGFNFSDPLLQRIALRRVEIFHSRLQLNKTGDANKFKAEVMAIIAMLTLHVMLELGISIAELNRISFLEDEIMPFFKVPHPQ